MTTQRIKQITDLLNDWNKDFKKVSWENGEGVDIECEGFIFSIPFDEEHIVTFETKEKEK